jgi:hypothetical protein
VRADTEAAVGKTPGQVQQQIGQNCGGSLQLLDSHLPADETVVALASAAPDSYRAKKLACLLVLTDRRLLFISAAPQVLSWKLPTITRVQALDGPANTIQTFFVDDNGGGELQLGADGEWGSEFVSQVEAAIAHAILRGQ